MSEQDSSTNRVETKPGEARLSTDLQDVLTKMGGTTPVTIGDVEEALKGRGLLLMIVILTAPFAILPMAPPGANMPICAVVILVGLRLMLGMNPWVPKAVLKREIGGSFVKKVLEKLLPISRKLEKWLEERWTFLFWPGAKSLIGLSLIWSAVLLVLPPPMLNSPPAISIMLFSLGVMTRDGLVIVLGYIVMAGTTLYLYLVGALIWASLMWGWVLVVSWFK